MNSAPLPPFDPWSATRADAERAHAAAPVDVHGTSRDPLQRWHVARAIEARRSRCEAPGNRDVLDCLSSCGQFDMDAPAWLTRALSMQTVRVSNAECLSWDVAFGGRPWPKGTRRVKQVRDAWLIPLVMTHALRISRAHRRLALHRLFELVSHEPDVPVSGATCERLYRVGLSDRQGVDVTADCRARRAAAKVASSKNTAPKSRGGGVTVRLHGEQHEPASRNPGTTTHVERHPHRGVT